MRRSLFGIGCLFSAALAAAPSPRPFHLDDLAVVRGVSDPEVSPDGAKVAYAVRTTDLKQDKHETHIWMTGWDGKETVRLTTGKESENTPRWSPDGKYLGFLSERGDENEATQLWILPRSGGEAEKLTEVKGDVEDFDWSPDGKRLVIVVGDPDPDAAPEKEGAKKPKTKKPIVIDRFQFKLDGYGYLVERHKHLYLLDRETRKVEPLTTGSYDEQLPSWSPDGTTIAFVSKRGPGSGPHRQLGRLRDRAARRRRGAQADGLRGLRQRSRVGRQPPRVEPRQQAHRLRAGRPRQAHLLRSAQARDRSGRRGPGEGPDPDARSQRPLAALHAGRPVDPLPAGGGPGRPPREDRRCRRPGRARRRRTARGLGLLDVPRAARRSSRARRRFPRRFTRSRPGRSPAAFPPRTTPGSPASASARSRRRASRARTGPRSTASS